MYGFVAVVPLLVSRNRERLTAKAGATHLRLVLSSGLGKRHDGNHKPQFKNSPGRGVEPVVSGADICSNM